MKTRILNIYLYQDHNELKLRMIEAHPLEGDINTNNMTRVERGVQSPFVNCLFSNLLHCNRYQKWSDVDTHNLRHFCYDRHPYTVDIIASYVFSEVIWT